MSPSDTSPGWRPRTRRQKPSRARLCSLTKRGRRVVDFLRVHRSGHRVPDVGGGRQGGMLLRALRRRAVHAKRVGVPWRRRGQPAAGVRRKGAAGRRGVRVYRLQSDRLRRRRTADTLGSCAAAPVVSTVARCSDDADGGRHVVDDRAGGDDDPHTTTTTRGRQTDRPTDEEAVRDTV